MQTHDWIIAAVATLCIVLTAVNWKRSAVDREECIRREFYTRFHARRPRRLARRPVVTLPEGASAEDKGRACEALAKVDAAGCGGVVLPHGYRIKWVDADIDREGS